LSKLEFDFADCDFPTTPQFRIIPNLSNSQILWVVNTNSNLFEELLFGSKEWDELNEVGELREVVEVS